MDGLEAGQGPVGNLIVAVAGGPEAVAEEAVLRGALLLRGLLVAPLAHQLAERAALLDAELVCADMLGAPGHDLAEGIRQGGLRELREPENEIHADVFHPGVPQDAEGLPGVRGVVTPVHPAEDPVVERLHAHADAGDAQVEQCADIVRPLLDDVLGVHLDGELRPGRFRIKLLVPRGIGAKRRRGFGGNAPRH